VTSLENIAVYKEHSLEEISDAQDEYRISSTIIKTPYQETPAFNPEDNPPKNLSYEMSVDSLEPNTTYYLIFWAERSLYQDDYERFTYVRLVLESLESCSISVVCRVGLINIDNGSGFSAYQGYIDDGTSWYPVSPYVDNGSGWDTYS
jgi:hypothetical protein